MGIFSKKQSDIKDEKTSKEEARVESAKKEENKSSMKDLYKEEKTTEVKKPVETKEKVVKSNVKKSGNAYRVLVKPLITEKASNLGVQNKYVFEVSEGANKIEITKAVNEVYGIQPIAVNIVRVSGKKVRQGRITGKRKNWKKAIITLPQGKTINIYEGV